MCVCVFVCVCTYCPELDKVLQHCASDEQAVDHGVAQEQNEELVVGEAHTVIYPGEIWQGVREHTHTHTPPHTH